MSLVRAQHKSQILELIILKLNGSKRSLGSSVEGTPPLDIRSRMSGEAVMGSNPNYIHNIAG